MTMSSAGCLLAGGVIGTNEARSEREEGCRRCPCGGMDLGLENSWSCGVRTGVVSELGADDGGRSRALFTNPA